ncbi:hypothetical protein [Corallococcus macrosporus]|uniref:Putative lipoprotein n=1 Tax=Myxococcus fulvus (strain ATCC BAA-855 / HW-1) TaxID=483219 RepID=F8CBG9_MYXFH|nr:hypothetical protein [Corallococcus macrosporus]AEI63376.1 putative lipoprotein [Corallococcus macrosporus]
MKRLFASVLTLSALAFTPACGDDDAPPNNPNNPGNPDTTEDVSANITQDTTWKTGHTYTLKNYVFVESGTLTIEPGARILGDEGSALVITRNARIHAVGTAQNPIVFTSSRPEGARAPGNWGGVVLLGKGHVNVAGGENTVEGFFASEGNELTRYGGGASPDATHDCGVLNYVRIEFAGFELAEDNELNGLTVAGCGSDTDLDFIQVHKGADDGIEFFGGSASLSHAVVTQADDDSLDYDLGYNGNIQFLVIQQNSQVGNYGIEASGNRNDNAATPRSAPEIWNATFIGSGRQSGISPAQAGMVFNTGAGGKLNNVIVAHFADFAVDVSGTASAALWNAATPELSLRNSFFWSNRGDTASIPAAPNPTVDSSGNITNPDASNFDEPAKVLASGLNNRVMDPQLTDAQNLTAPDFAPAAGSPALNPDNAATPPAGFDPSARFVGAVGAENWLAGWTAFPEK